MIRVIVEQVSDADPTKRRPIRMIEITDLGGLLDGGDCRAVSTGETVSCRRERKFKKTKGGPWKLIARAIGALKLDLDG